MCLAHAAAANYRAGKFRMIKVSTIVASIPSIPFNSAQTDFESPLKQPRYQSRSTSVSMSISALEEPYLISLSTNEPTSLQAVGVFSFGLGSLLLQPRQGEPSQTNTPH